MNYEKLYFSIIENRKKNQLDKNIYGENHHIIPRCLGGSNSKDNIVRLSAREHFLCHFCLVEMYRNDKYKYCKMLHAFMMMKASSYERGRYINSRLYEKLKVEYSTQQSNKMKTNKNPSFGTCWIHNLELKQTKKIKKDNLDEWIVNGWKLGRVINFNKKEDTIYIYSLAEERTIKVDKKYLGEYLNLGWKRGRMINFKQYKDKQKLKIKRKKFIIFNDNKFTYQQLLSLYNVFNIKIKSITQLIKIKKILSDLYYIDKLSLPQIASKFKCSHVSILNYFKLFSIDRRSLTDANYNKK